jgi:transposase
MSRILNEQERDELLVEHKHTRDKLVCDRIKAVLAYDQGYQPPEISRLMLISLSTVHRYLDEYQANQKLAPNYHGSKSKLNDDAEKKLIEHLKGKTYLYVKDICVYVKETFSVEYRVSGMTKWLHAHRFCYKKPHGVPAKADAEAQKLFLSKYQKLKEEAAMANEAILFVDSTHPSHQTQPAFGWILKGKRQPFPMTGCQLRVNIMGAINLADHHVETNTADTINAESIELFLEQIRKYYGNQKVHLILDNAGYHKSKRVKAAAEKLNIKLHYLPPYSPNLNAIERLWKIMKEKVTYNTYYAKFEDFKVAIKNFFSDDEKHLDILKSRITDNFPIINSPLLSN